MAYFLAHNHRPGLTRPRHTPLKERHWAAICFRSFGEEVERFARQRGRELWIAVKFLDLRLLSNLLLGLLQWRHRYPRSQNIGNAILVIGQELAEAIEVGDLADRMLETGTPRGTTAHRTRAAERLSLRSMVDTGH